jgi:Flp pilus assembly pilin Flp
VKRELSADQFYHSAPRTRSLVLINIVKGDCPVMKNQLKNFIKDESGQDVAEYALLLVLVGIAIAIASPSITASILSVFSRTKSVLGV